MDFYCFLEDQWCSCPEKSFSEEVEDIWNLEKIENQEVTVENNVIEEESTELDSIYKIQQERERDVEQLIEEEKTYQ